jgi:retinol-binding protein 3
MEKHAHGARVLAVLIAAAFFSTTSSAQWPDGGPDMTIDPKAKAEAVASLVKDLRDNYVFPDVGNKVAKMLEDGQARGAYNPITSAKQLSELLNKQMFDLAHDQHLHVLYSSQSIPPVPPPGAPPQKPDPQMLRQFKKDNYSFQELKRLDGNIGYLKMSAFSDAEQGGPTVAGAMAFLANTDALIIDLRENSGGYAAMVTLLASYFFDGEPAVHLNDLEWRKAGTRDYTLTQWWVFPSVPGPRYVGKEVYVLTSHDTPSAAEEFAYDLQTQKRATVVGETTWGGANPGEVLSLGDHFQVFMPTGHAVNPITKTNWEGLGVKPDIEVPKGNALRVAQKTALDHLVTKTSNEEELAVLKRALASLEGATEEPQKQ